MNMTKLIALRALVDELIAEAGGGQAAPAVDVRTVVTAPIRLARGDKPTELSLAAGQSQSFDFYHEGGVMEINVAIVPGRPRFNTITDTLTGPGQGFQDRKNTPAGEVRVLKAVAQEMPPGPYTYTLAPDVACELAVQKVQ